MKKIIVLLAVSLLIVLCSSCSLIANEPPGWLRGEWENDYGVLEFDISRAGVYQESSGKWLYQTTDGNCEIEKKTDSVFSFKHKVGSGTLVFEKKMSSYEDGKTRLDFYTVSDSGYKSKAITYRKR